MDKQRTTRFGGIQYEGVSYTDAGGRVIDILSEDTNGKILRCSGLLVPLASTAGYAVGCLFVKTDATAGQRNTYINLGTTTACNFALLAANSTSSSSS
jgi:hypothetical protein